MWHPTERYSLHTHTRSRVQLIDISDAVRFLLVGFNSFAMPSHEPTKNGYKVNRVRFLSLGHLDSLK